jgi:hypothetical protein
MGPWGSREAGEPAWFRMLGYTQGIQPKPKRPAPEETPLVATRSGFPLGGAIKTLNDCGCQRKAKGVNSLLTGLGVLLKSFNNNGLQASGSLTESLAGEPC